MSVTTAIPTRQDAPPDVLTHDGVAVELRYLAGDEVAVRITTPTDDVTTDAGADVLAWAVSRLRHGRTRVVRTALDASAPSAGAMLEALRGRVGADVGEITLRRAGSSVMVTLHLLPAPAGRPAGHERPRRDVRSGAPRTTRPRPAARRAPHAQESSR